MKLFDTAPIEDTKEIKGVLFPAVISFRQILFTGPPGSGKSTLVRKLGGWSEEGYVDLSLNHWWTAQSLSLRPREIHLGAPFKGHEKALAVFDEAWLEASPRLEIEFDRIQIPPEKRYFFSVDWRGRYAFEFLLPPPELLLQRRLERRKKGTHYVDERLELEVVESQLAVFEQLALFLHRQGMPVYLREDLNGIPLQIINPES